MRLVLVLVQAFALVSPARPPKRTLTWSSVQLSLHALLQCGRFRNSTSWAGRNHLAVFLFAHRLGSRQSAVPSIALGVGLKSKVDINRAY